ncbi:MAG: hypothetical protein AAGB34_05170 [Planctomycetota bacterium]
MKNVIAVCAVVCDLSSVHAHIAYDEAVSGDASSDPLAPTQVNLQLGTNTFLGSMVSPSDTRDYFTFEIAQGQTLAGIFLLEYTDLNTGGTGNRGFIHIDEGSTSVIPGGGTINEFLGGQHLDRIVAPTPGFNILPLLGGDQRQGGVGFDAPLGPGIYTINIQQTGGNFTGYSVALDVIPAPGSAAFAAFVGIMTIRRRRH